MIVTFPFFTFIFAQILIISVSGCGIVDLKPIYAEWTLLPYPFGMVYFQLMGIWLVVIITMFVDPDQTPRSAASDHCLRCLPMSHLWVAGHFYKWGKSDRVFLSIFVSLRDLSFQFISPFNDLNTSFNHLLLKHDCILR